MVQGTMKESAGMEPDRREERNEVDMGIELEQARIREETSIACSEVRWRDAVT